MSKRGDGPRLRRLEALLQALSGGAGSVTSVSGSAPIVSSGGPAPTISITPASDAAAGSMSAADKTKLDGLVPTQPFFVGYDSIVAPHAVAQALEPNFMDRDDIGTPMQITFPAWANNDVLEISFSMTLDLEGDGSTRFFRAYAAVSIDSGVTFLKLNYGGNIWSADPASGNPGFFSLSGLGSVVIPGIVPPIVRLAYFYNSGSLFVDSPTDGATASQGAILKATRIPSSSIIGTPPLSVLQAF